MSRIIICGSRNFSEWSLIGPAIKESGLDVTEVFCGCNGRRSMRTGRPIAGADLFGAEWAEALGIPVRHFPADWKKYGTKIAGLIRNSAMVSEADGVVAFPGPRSRGTWDIVRKARAKGIHVVVRAVES